MLIVSRVGMLIVSGVADADSLEGWVTRHQPAFLAYCPLAATLH